MHTPPMYTDPATRCAATKASPYREPIQCSLDAHTGGHFNHWTNTAWAAGYEADDTPIPALLVAVDPAELAAPWENTTLADLVGTA